MPPKKHPETPEEQGERFRREAEKLISAGDLDPDAGEQALETILQNTTCSTKTGTKKSTNS